MARVPRLPAAVLVDRPAVQLADVSVVEPCLLEPREPIEALAEGEPGGLDGAREARVHAEIEIEMGDHQREVLRLDAPVLAQRDRHGRVAVDALLDVVGRVAVPGEDEKPHEKSVCQATEAEKRLLQWPRANRGRVRYQPGTT